MRRPGRARGVSEPGSTAGAGRGGARPGGVDDASSPLLVARDPVLVEATLAAAAAAGVQPEVVREPAEVRARWRAAPVVLVGVEMAALVCGIALEPRTTVHLLGRDLAELGSWSAPLQASVLVLPEQSMLLTQVLEQGRVAAGDALVVRAVGGSGGLGTSTLCCALAQQAAERGLRSAVVELDDGGGLDLVFGAEDAPGWRWRDLRQAAGHVDSLAGRVPNVSGVDVVARDRPEPDGPPPGAARGPAGGWALGGRGLSSAEQPSTEAVRAVLASLCRSHHLVVLDGGGGAGSLLDVWPGERTLLLAGADVRGVVAAGARARRLGLHDAELVVRTGAGRRLEPDEVASALGVPLLGRLPDDTRIARAAEAGLPPGRGRGGYARGVREVLDRLLDGAMS